LKKKNTKNAQGLRFEFQLICTKKENKKKREMIENKRPDAW